MRKVFFDYAITPEKVEMNIRDEGKGFDFNNLPDPTNPENLFLEHGRGVLMTRLQMNRMEYKGSGNEVFMQRIFEQEVSKK